MALIDVSTSTKERRTGEAISPVPTHHYPAGDIKKGTSRLAVFSCLLLACIGVSWFAYQYFLLSQPQSFAPSWANARWIQASDGSAPVVYFRYSPYLEAVPTVASVTIGANDAFRLFVNSTLIGGNETDYVSGDSKRAYTFDITSALQQGPNGIVIRATDPDDHVPIIKANVHFILGSSSYDDGSGTTWRATSNSALVFPRFSKTAITKQQQSASQTTGPGMAAMPTAVATTSPTSPISSDTTAAQKAPTDPTIASSTITGPDPVPLTPWSSATFDVTQWPIAHIASISPRLTDIPVTPMIYNHALPNHWMSAGAQNQGYFVRQITISSPLKSYWLRFRASGPSNIFLNGSLINNWTGQPPNSRQSIFGSFSYINTDIKTHSRFSVGIYDIAPYLHRGTNTLAVYVSAPNVYSFIGNTGAAMSMDMLISDPAGNTSWSEASETWRASAQFVSGWEQGNAVSLNWRPPSFLASTTAFQQFSIPGSNTIFSGSAAQVNAITIPWLLVWAVIVGSVLAVVGLWLLMALTIGKRYYAPWPRACSIMSMAFLPALAFEALLIIVAREPHIARPFPYTMTWGLVLIALVLAGYLLLWMNATARRSGVQMKVKQAVHDQLAAYQARMATANQRNPISVVPVLGRPSVLSWFGLYWPVVLLTVIGCCLIIPILGYEPLWQDELVSFYVAKNSIAHGFPMMPSGFIYPKAELFHYMLGLIMLVFGDSPAVSRSLSAAEYIASIPLLYFIGSYFFGRRIALLATAMLTFSPFALTWGSQLRMYEQAQVCVLLMLYVFHRAALVPQSKRMPYIAIAMLIVTYLSHEETFIVMPALVLCVFMLTKSKDRLLPSVFYQKHWWYASLIGIAIIGAQLLVVKFSHPPVLGTDQSMRPNVQFHEDSLPFYTNILFFPRTTSPWLTLNSLLTLIGCIWAVRSKDARLRYCALFFVASLGTLTALFTMQADRYFYPLLTIYYLIGAYVVWKTLEYLWAFAYSQFSSMRKGSEIEKPTPQFWSSPIKAVSTVIASIVLVGVVLAPVLPLSSYNLGVSRVFGLSYFHHFSDYDASGQYIQQHWHKGDIILSMSPDIEMYYYAGRSDYYFSVDRALFLIERDGHAINTATGAVALLSQADFRALLSKNARVWIVTDHGSYQNETTKHFTVPPEFHIVFEGTRNAVYLRGT